MSYLPQANATLDAVQTPGTSEDWDQPAGGSTGQLLTGPIDAYVINKVSTVYSQSEGALRRFNDVQLLIPADVVQPHQVKAGMIVTYTYRGVQYSRRIQDYTDTWMAGMPHMTVRLHLDPMPAEEPVEVGS